MLIFLGCRAARDGRSLTFGCPFVVGMNLRIADVVIARCSP
jgi:hypothetical protein